MYRQQKVSVVIPALNEEQAIGLVLAQLWQLTAHQDHSIIDEVIVCDNGSTDNTAQIAVNAGAKVVFQKQPGYGIACLTGIAALSNCDIVLFVDGDDSCFIPQALPLLDAIIEGADLAIGSRTLGNIQQGALTGVQRFGNLLSSTLIRLIWQHPISDLGPFRAITSAALQQLSMQDQAFGWTVEMQVKAIQQGLVMVERPVDSKIRIGTSKISGTIKGSIGAGTGILGMIAKLRWQQNRYLKILSKKPNKLFNH
jgi:glycosyltransferase involved in cell wall biosynthesis